MYYMYKGVEYKINYNVVDYSTGDYDIWLENPEDEHDIIFADKTDFATQGALYDIVDEDVAKGFEEFYTEFDAMNQG